MGREECSQGQSPQHPASSRLFILTPCHSPLSLGVQRYRPAASRPPAVSYFCASLLRFQLSRTPYLLLGSSFRPQPTDLGLGVHPGHSGRAQHLCSVARSCLSAGQPHTALCQVPHGTQNSSRPGLTFSIPQGQSSAWHIVSTHTYGMGDGWIGGWVGGWVGGWMDGYYQTQEK